MALLGARSIAGWIYDSISFTVAQQKNLSTNFPDSFDVSQRLISLMIESPMITDTFLFFEFLLLLLMLFCLFELIAIFFLLCTFQVVISCFGMLSLLCFRLNFFGIFTDFCNGNVIVVLCKCWKLVWWSCVLIRNGYHVIFCMLVRYVTFVMSKRREPVSIRNIDHVISCVFLCDIIFLDVIVPAFFCPFSYVLEIVLVFNQRMKTFLFLFFSWRIW